MHVDDQYIRWYNTIDELPDKPDANAQVWLCEVSHMTQTLEQCFGSIRIQVIDQSWQQPVGIENQLLSLTGHKIWQRLTMLKTSIQPLLFARVAITSEALQTWPILGCLGQRSIGDMFLHNHQEITRDSFYYTLLNTNHPLLQLLKPMMTTSMNHWARVSLINAGNEPIIALTEVLLAPLVQAAKPSLSQ
jgi:chorismate-pyruvate lyase